MRVLYVEDGMLDAELACRQLSEAASPIEVDLVHSIEEAIARLERDASDYDLVLSDLGLPDGDGVTLLAHIRQLGLPLAVVITTGTGDERAVVAALRAGADDYVIKGADYMAHLPAVLEGALGRFRAVHARRVRSLRVLYAEDNEMDAELVRHHVARHAPYIHLDVVDRPERVHRLLSKPTEAPYDLLLLDYRLPGTNGLDMLRELRQVHGLDIPIVLITGQGDEEIARQALRLGAADYIVKRGEYVQRLPFVLENAFHRAQLVREQAALRESEERYRSIVELAPDGIVTVDLLGVITSCNSAFLEQTGFNRDEIVGRHYTTLPTLHPDEFAAYAKLFAQAVQGTFTGPFEFKWYHKSGTQRWGEARLSLVKKGPAVAGIQVIVADISERKRAGRLLQALNRAALAMERVLTPDEIFTAVAQELETLDIFCAVLLAGESQDVLVPRYLRYLPGTIEAIQKLLGIDAAQLSISVDTVDVLRRVVCGREAFFVEDAEGVIRAVLPRPLKGFAGKVVKMMQVSEFVAAPLVVEDRVIGLLSVQSADLTPVDVPTITAFAHQMAAAWHRAQLYEQARQEIAERVRAEEALRASEERFRTLVQNSSDIIVVLEADDTVRYISPSVERVLGHPPDYFIGKNPIEFVHPADVAPTRDKLAAAVQRPGVPIPHEFRVCHVDGSWVSLDTLINNLLHIPSVGGLVVNARDVTERTRLEEQFLQAQKMEAVGRLAGGIAHDFNNLLTAMQGYTSLLLSDLGSDRPLDESWKQAMRDDLTEVKLAADRAAGLTQQLLAFSRRQVLQPRVLNLNGLVRGMENMLRRLIGEDIELDTMLAPSLGTVLVDPGQVEQVIMNLVVNARDAMPQGGRLTLKTANVELDEAYALEHPGSQPGTYVLLAVSDTGIFHDQRR
jgi:PAS domain S-box-containing protein